MRDLSGIDVCISYISDAQRSRRGDAGFYPKSEGVSHGFCILVCDRSHVNAFGSSDLSVVTVSSDTVA